MYARIAALAALTLARIAALAALTLVLAGGAAGTNGGSYHTALIHQVDVEVFGAAEAPVADCIADHESTEGYYLVNGTQLGIFQINWPYHESITGSSRADLARLEHDFRWNAEVAYRVSDGGRDWGPWSTAAGCGV